jgi:MFS transporter, DHA2 family, multidrug resistance protein
LRGETPTAVPNRGWITASIMLANIMQGVDNTIANVALPHIQGSLSASQDQIAWVLTSYIVAAAITMPLTGWMAGRIGIKYVFLFSVGGFTVSSALCGAAASLEQLVLYRFLQGVCGAGLIPLSQAVLLQINPPERHGKAMAVYGIGTMMGPISGPLLGGWLTESYSWRWIFYVNVPVGILCVTGIMVFIRFNRNAHRESFDAWGFLFLSLAIGAMQLMLDRGELKDWFRSREIWIEATIAALSVYMFTVHTVTASGRTFINRELLGNTNFIAGTVLMFAVGAIMTGTIALLPTMLQQQMDYPVFTTGIVVSPRALGSLVAMFAVARVINRVDNRLLILIGLALTAFAMWQMTQFSLDMDYWPLVTSGFIQGFGLGCTFVPLNVTALSTLPRHILTQGTALRSLMRNLGGSVGISALVAILAENTQTVHSQLIEGLRPDNPIIHSPLFGFPYSLTAPTGVAALNAAVTRQATMVAYIDDFWLLMVVCVVSIPLLLLLRDASPVRPAVPAPAAAAAVADD